MTEKQKAQLKKLLEMKEEEDKAEANAKKFLVQHREDSLKLLGLDGADEKVAMYEKFSHAAEEYGCPISDLLDYITSEQQVSFYKRSHKTDTLDQSAETFSEAV